MKYFDDLRTITSDCVERQHNGTPAIFQKYQDDVSGILEMAKLVDCKLTYSFHSFESYGVSQFGSHVMTYYSIYEIEAFLLGMLTMQTRKENEKVNDYRHPWDDTDRNH